MENIKNINEEEVVEVTVEETKVEETKVEKDNNKINYNALYIPTIPFLNMVPNFLVMPHYYCENFNIHDAVLILCEYEYIKTHNILLNYKNVCETDRILFIYDKKINHTLYMTIISLFIEYVNLDLSSKIKMYCVKNKMFGNNFKIETTITSINGKEPEECEILINSKPLPAKLYNVKKR